MTEEHREPATKRPGEAATVLPASSPPPRPPVARSLGRRLARLLLPLGAAVGLTLVFWWGLWAGGGLIGGDLYSYFFPQKAFYAERLAAGELPLWNNRAGHGYPLVGESQTGAFYPLHLAAYRLWDVNTAYNAVQLLHYVLAFVFTWMYARKLGLGAVGCGLAALVYTYGWFPPRISLEWAILGGAWLPLVFWCAEDWLMMRRRVSLLAIAVALALQMLPGHFNLAFITLLALAAYIPARLWFARGGVHEKLLERRGRSLLLAAGAIALAFGLAAVQLVPGWELKQRSQRATVGELFDPGFGVSPPEYWSLIVAPWLWYDYFGGPAPAPPELHGTNSVEAHLYFGLVPVALLLYGAAAVAVGCVKALRGRTANGARVSRPVRPAAHAETGTTRAGRPVLRSPMPPGRPDARGPDRRLVLWLLLGLAALVYTSGWLLPVTKHLPGFSFFLGPGRYGIVTTFAAALLAGAALDRLLTRQRTFVRSALALLVLAATAADLWMMSRLATHAIVVNTPPLKRLDESPLRPILREFEETSGPVRLFSRGPNLPTLLGVASTPPYLGIGPDAYFDPRTTLPGRYPFDERPTPEQIEWLQRAGVTHVLSFTPLDPHDWPATFVWAGYDSLLNPAWGRREPLYLYHLTGTRGRVAWQVPQPDARAQVVEYAANRVVVEASSSDGGRLILTDLDWPGWTVTIDDEPAEPIVVEGVYRGVEVPPGPRRIVWSYRPSSLVIGGMLSAATMAILLACGIAHGWPPRVQRP